MTAQPDLGLRPEAVGPWRLLNAQLRQALDDGEEIPCRADPESWVGDDTSLRYLATRCCVHCPLRDACQGFALANAERRGVWGGQDRDARCTPRSITPPTLQRSTEDRSRA